MFHGAYDRFLDAEWDRYCDSLKIKDGEYEGRASLGPLSVMVRYTVRDERPEEIVGLYVHAWCPATLRTELVEISESVDYQDEEVLALVNPAKDKMVSGFSPFF